MELLSPAGNLKHIELAIDKKVDAVYGGLKEWNARSKAMNFSIEEYNSVVSKLHENGIKFYLTLNTLVFDEEIDDIIEFLERKDTILPDSFIIADIGLIRKIKNKFPSIPLHFSTQFGIHNISDVKFAEILGAERAILARELTMNEIEKIIDNTSLEIENFVWGSQCISFSGLCFFGSLINCGNSNRGKCIITCRDIYQIESDKGNFLYVPDLDCTGMIPKLEKSDVDCIKLEGRRRSNKELSKIIDDIRENTYKTEQNGYIYGQNIKDNKLYEKINKRIKLICNIKELKDISKYDIFINFDKGVPQEFIFDNFHRYNAENVFYVFSEYKEGFRFDRKNISIDLNVNRDIIDNILYVNSNGTGKIFNEFETSDYISFSIEKFTNDIKKINNEINLYKVKYIRNKDNQYRISKKLYDLVLSFIGDDNLINDKHNEVFDTNFKIRNLFVETDRIDYVLELQKIPLVKIIYNITTIKNLRTIKSIVNKLGKDVIYKLPLFNFKSEDLKKYYIELENMSVMFTRPSQLFETKDIKFEKKYIDYTVYVWNKESLEYMKEYGVTEFTASPELSYDKNKEILRDESIQYIVAGRLPLVYTRQCFRDLYKCDNCEGSQERIKNIINIDKNIKFKIICNEDYRILVSDNPMLNNYQRYNNSDNISFRYVTTGQKLNEIMQTIEILMDKEYYKKLKNTSTWKDSFEGNILGSRC